MKTIYHLTLPVVVLIAVLFAPASGWAQSILLTAGNFTLLGGSAITSTATVGTTISNGNVGLSPTATSAITGFPPAVVTGGAVIATGEVTAQARTDLLKAAAGLVAMPTNVNLTATPDLGGMTLAPGVYKFDAAVAMTGTLTLDAQGRNNVFWVFQIGSTLTTAVNSSVNFINFGSNGGSDLGVFWNAGAAINIGATNQMEGNYLAGTSISIGALTQGGGRALALAGITLNNDQINAKGGPGGGGLTGGLMYDLGGAVVPSSIPEPAAILWLAPLGALGLVLWRRFAVGSRRP